MDKVIRNGKVAVLIAPNYGGGWSSWAHSKEAAIKSLFDPEMVEWVENGKIGPRPDLYKKYGDEYFYDGAANDLIIQWVPVGAKFFVHEYDGSESICFQDEIDWITA